MIYQITMLLGIVMVAMGAAGLGSLCQEQRDKWMNNNDNI